MDNEDFEEAFGDSIDPNKIELDFALEALAGMFLGLLKHGLTADQAAVLAATLLIKQGEADDGKSFGDGKS